MRKTRIVGSAIVGNIVEYYDFGIFAVFAPTIGKLFFPNQDPFVQTMLAFSVFAMGFLMRPIGGIFFGHIGDIFGRKIALTASIICMAFATFGIGILPSYEQIGVTATICLIIVRLVQGICVGGEGAGSAVFILEHLEGYKPGLIGSIVMASNIFGTLFAIFIGIVLTHFFPEDPYSWRYGFIFGGILGLSGLYLRNHVDETPVFKEMQEDMKKNKSSSPIIQVIRDKWRRVIVISSLSGLATSMAYMIRAYLNVFFLQFLNYTTTESMFFTALALFILIISLPFCGLLADRIGYHKFLKISCFCVIILIIPIFSLIANYERDIPLVFIGLIFFSILAAAVSAPAYPYAIQAFTPALRYSGVALSWNVGNAFFGGTTPTISTYLTHKFGLEAPAFYLIAICCLFLVMSYFTKSKKY